MKNPKSAFLLAILLLSFNGCQTSPEITQPGGRNSTYQGQLRYAGAGNPIIGEVIVRSGTAEHFQMDFLSGPGFPLMRLQIVGDRGTAEGIIARGRWHGQRDKAPTRIAGWFVLPDIFASAAKKSGVLQGEHWKANSIHSDGKLTRLEATISESGETFTFHFGA